MLLRAIRFIQKADGGFQEVGEKEETLLNRSWENGSHDSNETVLTAFELQEALV